MGLSQMLGEYPVNQTYQQLPTEGLARCWVDWQKLGEEERRDEGPNLTWHMPSSKDKGQAEGRKAERQH